MRLKYPLRKIGERVYRTSRAYTIARNAELLRESLLRPQMLSQQVQRTLFTTRTKTQSSCPQEIFPKDKKPQTNAAATAATAAKTEKTLTEDVCEGGEANVDGGINKERFIVVPGDGSGGGGGGGHGGKVVSAYGENFKKRYGGGRVRK